MPTLMARSGEPGQDRANRVGPIFFGNLIGAASLSAVALITAQALGASRRGELVLVITAASFVALLFGIGTDVSGRYLLVAEPHLRGGDYLGLSLVLAASGGLATFLITGSVLPHFGVGVDSTLTTTAASYAVVLLLGKNFREMLHAHGLHAHATFARGGALSLAGFTALLLAVRRTDSVSAYLSLLLLFQALEVGVLLVLLARRGHLRSPTASRSGWRRALTMGSGAIGVNISQALMFRLDRYIIAVLLGPAAVGIYSVAASLAELVRLIPSSISEPIFRKVAIGRHGTIPQRRARRTALALVAGSGCVGFAAAVSLVGPVLGQEFEASLAPLAILLAAELAMASFVLDSKVLAGAGAAHLATLAGAVGLTIVVAADVALIPALELVGAGVASALGYGAMAAICFRFARPVLRRQPVEP